MDSVSNESKEIICPVITTWIFFVLNFAFFYKGFDYLYDFTLKENIVIVSSFIISILVTVSYEKSKYYLYLTSIILCSIFDLLITIFIFHLFKGHWIGIILILGEWAHFFVLMIYNNKINVSYNNANLKEN